MRPLGSTGCMISRPRSRAKTTPGSGAGIPCMLKPELQPGSRSHVIPALVAALSDPV